MKEHFNEIDNILGFNHDNSSIVNWTGKHIWLLYDRGTGGAGYSNHFAGVGHSDRVANAGHSNHVTGAGYPNHDADAGYSNPPHPDSIGEYTIES